MKVTQALWRVFQSVFIIRNIFSVGAALLVGGPVLVLADESLLDELNRTFGSLHTTKEDLFWSNLMGHRGACEKALSESQEQIVSFQTDQSLVKRVNEALARKDLSPRERQGLSQWKRYFGAYRLPTPESQALYNHIETLESALHKAVRQYVLSYRDPESGQKVVVGINEISAIIQTDPSEARRKAALEGFRKLETFVLENGFIEIVKKRNQLARLLGFKDYFDFKIRRLEGMSKEELFSLLDSFRKQIDHRSQERMKELVREHGPKVRDAWNFGFLTSGDLKKERDPYHPFQRALNNWGKTFQGLGVSYRGGTLRLDLVERPGKEANGFMHGPELTYVDADGQFHPGRAHFTANVVPGQIDSGYRAEGTFLHEAGHAAHFSNIEMPDVASSQEFSPTSMAFAETQSMFMDSFQSDPMWLAHYAKTREGVSMPADLIERVLMSEHKNAPFRARWLMTVPYYEKAIYEMSDDELTVESLTSRAREVETEIMLTRGTARPLLTVMHLRDGAASCSYQGYLIAEMLVYQTRAQFQKRFGTLLHNPQIGKTLTEGYWQPGNSKTLQEFALSVLGEAFSPDRLAQRISRTDEEVRAAVKKGILRGRTLTPIQGPVDLEATIELVHGEKLIASNREQSFEEMAEEYSTWLDQKTKDRETLIKLRTFQDSNEHRERLLTLQTALLHAWNLNTGVLLPGKTVKTELTVSQRPATALVIQDVFGGLISLGQVSPEPPGEWQAYNKIQFDGDMVTFDPVWDIEWPDLHDQRLSPGKEENRDRLLNVPGVAEAYQVLWRRTMEKLDQMGF